MKRAMWWLLPVLLMFGAGACLAQSTNSGDIRGTVTDTTGALVPGVTVTVMNVNTGVSKDYTTNDVGLYDTSSIVTGSYTVTFTKTGFETLVRGPVSVQVGFTTVNAELKVGSMKEQVTVTTDVPLLQTENGEQTTTLEQKSLVALPQVTQNWENFTILLPGATGTANGSQGSSNPGQEVAVNGNMPYSNILADGASTTLSHSQNANPAGFENISELQVNASSFSAQYGIGGIIFNQVSKSGTNKFHGTVYDFFQNDALTARSYFDAPDQQAPPLRYNNFGAAISGPILKNKMFFYFNYDQTVNHGSSTGFNSLPTDGMHEGDFTGINTLYDPTTQTIAYDTAGNPYPVRQSFASEYGNGNRIPAALFDPVAAAFQQWFPTADNHKAGLSPATGYVGGEGELHNNWYYNLQQSNPVRRYFGRLDYDITPNNRLTMSDTQAVYSYPGVNSIAPCPIGCQAGDVDNNNAQVTDVWNISSRTINEARIGYTWQGNFFNDLALGRGYAAQLGWQFAKADDFPGFGTSGTYPYSWLSPSSNAVYKEHVFDFSDVVTMVRGKHILHFGGELLMYQDNSTAWGNSNAGMMLYSGDYTKQWALDGSGIAHPVAGTGFEYADFLLGYINNWWAGVTPEYGARLKSPQMFVQDDIKLRPNLTINLGLRYQINHGWNEVHGNIMSFDATVTNPADGSLGAMWYAGTHANGRTALQADVYNTVLPRVGFSWAMRPNTTIRGGFGLYAYNWSLDRYGNGMGQPFGSSGGYGDPSNGITPVAILGGNGNLITPVTGGDSGTPLPYTAFTEDPTRFNGQGATYQEYHTPVPKIYQWNLSVQRALTTNLMTEIAYVGSHGFNLSFPTDLNQVPADKLGPNDNPSGRPYPNFQGIQGSTNNGWSNYNSLQASITKRMTSGLSLSFNYVWSHFLDTGSTSGWGSRAGSEDFQINIPRENYASSNFDVRHAFKGYAVYQLPFGRGKQYLSGNRALDEVVGGWQISGTVVLQTGNPFNIYADQNTYSQAGRSMPNWNPGVSWKPAHQTIHNWINPAAFTRPADGTFGNVRRNSVYGPGINQFDLSLAKAFALPWESVKLQFRADAQNVFNHPSFSPPDGQVGGAADVGAPYTTIGEIGGTTVSGRNLQLAVRLTF